MADREIPKYVYYFGGGRAEGSGNMKNLLGGKGAGLAEMVNLGIPVVSPSPLRYAQLTTPAATSGPRVSPSRSTATWRDWRRIWARYSLILRTRFCCR